jgi:signal transduction histidine kinase
MQVSLTATIAPEDRPMVHEPIMEFARAEAEARLALIGRVAHRISESPAPKELCVFVYNLLSQALPIDSLYVAVAARQSEVLHGMLIMVNGVEYPPESLIIEDQHVVFGHGPVLLADPEDVAWLPFSGNTTVSSAIICAMRFGGRIVGQICVASSAVHTFAEDDLQLVQMVADQVGAAFELDQIRREFEVRESELQAMLDRDRQYSSSLSVDISLRELARALVRVSGADAVIIAVLSQDADAYTPVAYHALAGISLEGLLDPIAPEVAASIVAMFQGPGKSGGVRTHLDGSRWEQLTRAGWNTQIIVPMLLGDHFFGLIEIGSQRDGFTFSDAAVELCRILVEQAAIGVRQTRLSEQAVQQSTSLSELAEFSDAMNNAPEELPTLLRLICDEASRLLHASHASLFLLNESEQRLELEAQSGVPGSLEIGAHIAIDYPFSLVARAARERRLIIEADLARDGTRKSGSVAYVPFDVGRAKCAIVAPLRHNGTTLGVLLLTDRRRRKIFHSDEINLVTSIAAHAAAALARSQIRAVELERFHITAALGRISASIGTEDRPSTIYAQILREAASLIAYDEASVCLIEDSEIRVVASTGPALSRVPQNQATVRLWREPETINLATCMRDAALSKLIGAARFADLLSYPMFVNGTIVGRLTFATRRSGLYDSHQTQLAALLAERTAQVVSTVQLRAAQEEALGKLTRLDEMRQDFIATVSHELRTPLTGILGYLELLLTRWTTLDDGRRREMIERTQSAATRLEHLLNDLLLFSSMEHEGVQLHIAAYSIEALIDQACEVMRTKYRGQDLEIRRGQSAVRVLADAQRSIQVVANLLDNAIKYSSVGSRVHVRWTAHRHEVEVTIRDHGPGINQADASRLFTRFGTLGHQPRPGQVGTGIGLYVSKKMIEAMDGRIWQTSRPGFGSTFHFTLPRPHD